MSSKRHKKTVFNPFIPGKELKKASSPLNGYVAVFSIVGRRKHVPSTTRRTIKQVMDILSSSTPPRECGSAKSCASEGRSPPIKPASGQDLMCCVIQRNVRLTRGPNSSHAVECSYSNWVRPAGPHVPAEFESEYSPARDDAI